MSFLLLLLEKYPNLIVPINDVWFRIQLTMKGFERNAAESKLFTLARSCFNARPNEVNERTKWELVKSENEILTLLNTFFNDLR